MLNWSSSILVIIGIVIGSGGLAGLIIPILNHKFEQRRDFEREERAARAARIARQRQMCLDLLEAVSRQKSMLHTMRSLHDDRASRPTAKKQLELMTQQLPSFSETVHRFRRELDLEPNVQLQAAIESWGNAGMAYLQALMNAMTSTWNPVRFFIGKAPEDEVNRLTADFETQTQELQDAVRQYKSSLASSVKVAPARRFLRLPWRRKP